MTNTVHLPASTPEEISSLTSHGPTRTAGESLVAQIVRSVQMRIDDKLLRTGVRMPSIRQYAETHRVSRSTVVDAYDRLVAQGYLESRRGSGFYVQERAMLHGPASGGRERDDRKPPQLDVVWLVRNMFRQSPPQQMPGSGVLPNSWLNGDLIADALRAVSRQNPNLLLQYGTPQGFLPLRQQLQLKLAELEIAATPEQIVTTAGVTQGLDIVARHFLRPGDTVFVDDPAWFLMFGSFVTMGAKVIGIPRMLDGPDIGKLAELAAIHKPKLFVINSVLHNPTSTSLSSAKAFQVLKIAEQHDFFIVEDDVYCDMHAGRGSGAAQAATRIAALDQLQRVIYLGGFSKTLAANLRVGFIAASEELATRLTDRKMLCALSSAEIGERIVYKILSEGYYRKHVDRLRAQLDRVRDKMVRELESVGLRIDINPAAGMFLWADAGRDTNTLAEAGLEQGILLAPGSLFSPNQLPSTRIRINIGAMSDPAVLKFFERSLTR
jgi:DNA-binding transcriptional MocR family regulator